MASAHSGRTGYVSYGILLVTKFKSQPISALLDGQIRVYVDYVSRTIPFSNKPRGKVRPLGNKKLGTYAYKA